jgi:hypothetical protein
MTQQKSMIAAFALLGISMANAGAANDPLIVWQGAPIVTSMSDSCDAFIPGIHPGHVLISTFRPKLESDEPPSGISFIISQVGVSLFQTGGADEQMHGAGTYQGPRVTSRLFTPGVATGTFNFKIKPGSITADTEVITIKGTVDNFFGAPDCTMKFVGAYQQRPD